ncbi:TPA_asm: hypothetical protein G2179_19025 [Salmonella enterica subsp. enterica serovar Give]|nr:hypothetical protein [Salmonella enterica subsp. enterica serovar Give]HAD9834429.1 hypothetical protein [Salmonella enterica subsp. enterica serovar Give]
MDYPPFFKRKYMRKLFISCLVGAFSLKANAAYRHFLFSPLTPINIETDVITVDDYTTSINLSASGGPNGPMWGTNLMSRCSGGSDLDSATQDKTAWLIVPKQVKVNGIQIIVDVLNNNGWFEPNQRFPSGYTGKITQKTERTLLETCWTEGDRQLVTFYWRDATVKLTIPRQKILPGSYSVLVPYYYGHEENKFTDEPAPAYDIPAKIISSGNTKGNFSVTINVTSKCNLDTSPVNLSHGLMAGRGADGNQTKSYNLNVTCTPGTSLSVKLLGSQKVSGKTDNYTKCGTGGMCELTFDNGKYNETMTVNNNKTLSIKSTYRLNDITKPVAESFEGSGVLQVQVN